jgi:hypothetical protein
VEAGMVDHMSYEMPYEIPRPRGSKYLSAYEQYEKDQMIKERNRPGSLDILVQTFLSMFVSFPVVLLVMVVLVGLLGG